MEIGRSRTTIGQTIMRLLATFFVLVFSSLVFSQAMSAPHDPAIISRKSTVDPSDVADTKKNKETKNAKKSNSSTQDKKKNRNKPLKTKTTADADNDKKNKHSSKQTPATTHSSLKKDAPSHQSASPKIAKRLSRGQSTLTLTKKAPKRGRHARNDEERTTTAHVIPNKKNDVVDTGGLALSSAHKQRSQRAKVTAINKLMSQIGKPYHWGGSSPYTGFDCSGLVYYAYKDIVKIPIPRTANEMFHLRDAAPIKKNELESGDLVFFRINHRGTADHVGVYVGNGKFIQSPRAGSDIKISKLSEDYWQEHYIGARRVVMPQTVR